MALKSIFAALALLCAASVPAPASDYAERDDQRTVPVVGHPGATIALTLVSFSQNLRVVKSEIRDARGHKIMGGDYDILEAVSNRLVIAQKVSNQHILLLDPSTKKIRETDFTLFGNPTAENDVQRRFRYIAKPVQRQSNGPAADTAYLVRMLGQSGEVLAEIPEVGGDARPFAGSRWERLARQNPLKPAIRASGNVLIVNYEAPDGSPRSKLYNVEGRPLSPELPPVLNVTYHTGNFMGNMDTVAEVALQGPELPAGSSLGYDMAFIPLGTNGQPVPLPPGAIGMIPLGGLDDGIQRKYAWLNDRDRFYDVTGAHGWATVFYEGNGRVSFAPAYGLAADAARTAASGARFSELRWLNDRTVNGEHYFAARGSDGRWTVFDSWAQPAAIGSDPVALGARLTAEAAQRRRDAEAEARREREQAIAAERAAEARKAQALAEARQHEIARRDASIALYREAAARKDGNAALNAAWSAGCDTFVQAYANFGGRTVSDAEHAQHCGLAQEQVLQHAPPVYFDYLENMKRAGKKVALANALREWSEAMDFNIRNSNPSNPTITVRTYHDGTSTDETMTIKDYQARYGSK